MTLFRPLRNELYKYRKNRGRSIDGMIPGTAGRFRKLTTPSTDVILRGAGYDHDLYMGDMPRQYHPNIHAPNVDWTTYEQDHPHDVSLRHTPQSAHGFDPPFGQQPFGLSMPCDELALSEQWLMNMGARPRPQEGPVPGSMEEIRPLLDGVRMTIHEQGRPETHTIPSLEDVADALNVLEKSLPEDHPDIMHLRQAFRVMGGQLSAPTEDLLPQTALPADLPVSGLPEQTAFFEAMELEVTLPNAVMPLDDLVDSLMAAEPGPAPAPVEMPMHAAAEYSDIAAYDGTLAAAEIEQAIDQMMAVPKEEELYDPLAAGAQQFEQAMQYMANPFMMPGQMGFTGPMPGPGF
ncbi:MAG: hypothetical protein IH624_03850 [Phycisphaerae bacterium]|nr:hypothetical protein [Phycisphaerae bacterium]